MLHGTSLRVFGRDLVREVQDDNVANGAAALAFYIMLALFPAAIFVLTLLPYLPIPRIEMAIMDLLRQALPGEAAALFNSTVRDVVSHRNGALLSFGLLFTLWSASSGMYAVMQQLNVVYDVEETRSFVKARARALLLTGTFVVLVIGSLGLVVFGGVVQGWIGARFGFNPVLLGFFATFRWVVIGVALMFAFALTYYIGPDVKHRFRLITPGSVFGVVGIAGASLLFKLYVAHFAKFNATYGGLGAVIVLLMWLYVTGWVLLLGGELNALLDHYREGGAALHGGDDERDDAIAAHDALPAH